MPLVKTGETAICHWCGQTIERDEDTDGKGPGRYDWDADGDYGCNDNPLTSPAFYLSADPFAGGVGYSAFSHLPEAEVWNDPVAEAVGTGTFQERISSLYSKLCGLFDVTAETDGMLELLIGGEFTRISPAGAYEYADMTDGNNARLFAAGLSATLEALEHGQSFPNGWHVYRLFGDVEHVDQLHCASDRLWVQIDPNGNYRSASKEAD